MSIEERIMKTALAGGTLAVALAALAGPAAAQSKVIDLTQVPCQFLESEGQKDRGFKSSRAADCEAINAKSAQQRLAEAKPLQRAPAERLGRGADHRQDAGLRDRAEAGELRLFVPAQSDARLQADRALNSPQVRRLLAAFAAALS